VTLRARISVTGYFHPCRLLRSRPIVSTPYHLQGFGGGRVRDDLIDARASMSFSIDLAALEDIAVARKVRFVSSGFIFSGDAARLALPRRNSSPKYAR